MDIVALEEHYATDDVVAAWQALDAPWRDPALEMSADDERDRRLRSLDEERLAVMDDAGVDVQVLSLTSPGLFPLTEADAVALQGPTNDALAAAVAHHPDRFQGFATLAPQRPEAAADELRRAVTDLGFHGALIFSRVRDEPIDRSRFWPVFEAAEALRAPLYLHPQTPPAAVREAYYGGFDAAVDTAFATFGIGWHYDAGVEVLRMIYAGVFDRFPDLQVILGHWGEVAAFYLDRIDRMAPIAGLARPVSEYFAHNVFVTPGGVFSQRYLGWALDVMGADRILFAADYPYVPAGDGAARRFLAEADLTDADRAKIASENWAQLRASIRR